MKICILGNSHLGALKEGVNKKASLGKNVDFFGAWGTALKELRISQGQLFTNSPSLQKKLKALSGGTTTYDLNSVETIIVTGGQLHITSALKLFLKYRPYQFHDNSTEIISEDGFLAALLDSCSRTTAVHLLKLIRPMKKRVVVMPAPMRNELILDGVEYPFLGDSDRAKVRAYIRWLTSMCLLAWKNVCSEHEAELLLQNPATLAPSGLTGKQFARAKSIVDGEWTDKPDDIHANGDYGILALQHLRKYLENSR